MQQGYIRLYRCIKDKGWSRDPHYVALWVWLLMRACYKDTEVLIDGRIKVLKPGQLLTSRPQMTVQSGIERNKIERILKLFESEQQIEQQTFTKYRIISILNWDKFQAREQQIEQQMSSKRATDEQQMSTYNKEKKEKESIGEKQKRFSPPTLDEVSGYCKERNRGVSAEKWYNHYQAKGWMVGKSKMKDWKAAVRTWEADITERKEPVFVY